MGVTVRVFGSFSRRKFYPLPQKKFDLVFNCESVNLVLTVNQQPGIILTPLASALDCGSEGLKSSAPSSTRFSSSSDEQEKNKHR